MSDMEEVEGPEGPVAPHRVIGTPPPTPRLLGSGDAAQDGDTRHGTEVEPAEERLPSEPDYPSHATNAEKVVAFSFVLAFIAGCARSVETPSVSAAVPSLVREVALRRVHRFIGYLRILSRVQPPVVAIEEYAQHKQLPLIEPLLRRVCEDRVRALYLGDHVECMQRRALVALEKPHDPLGHIEVTSLRAFQHVVVPLLLGEDLSRHRNRHVVRHIAREEKIGDRARDPSVAVGERMNRHEHEVREGRRDQPIADREL